MYAIPRNLCNLWMTISYRLVVHMKPSKQNLLVFVLLLLTLGTPRTQPSFQNVPITIPVDITSYGGIILPTRVNNSQPLSFYLDSGASTPFAVNAAKAKALGLKLQETLLLGGGAGPNLLEASHADGLTIALEHKTFNNQRALVVSFKEIEEQFGRPVDGLVGIGLFLNNVVEIDYIGKKLRLYDPQAFVYSGAGASVPLALRAGHFFVPAVIDIPSIGKLTGQFVVDTGGCMITVVLTTPFAQRNRLPVATQKTILDRSIAGLGGDTTLLVGRANNLELGGSVVPSPLIYISQDKGGALASSEYEGLIGTEILRKFKVIFDYSRRRLILERNVNFDEPVEYDMSGMSVRAYGDDFKTFKIYRVLEDSPAGRAGLHWGDVIERIDGEPASRLTLEQIMQMMRVPGREYKLGIQRSGETSLVHLTTRRLI